MFIGTINTTGVFNLKDVSREKLRAIFIDEDNLIENIEVFIGTKNKNDKYKGKYVITISGSNVTSMDPTEIIDKIFSWFKKLAKTDIIPINFNFCFSLLDATIVNIFQCNDATVIYDDMKNGEINMVVIESEGIDVLDSYSITCDIRL